MTTPPARRPDRSDRPDRPDRPDLALPEAETSAVEARDRLVERIASGDLSADRWTAWARAAGDDAAAWRAMAESLRDQLLLVEAAAAAAEVADRVELPPAMVTAAEEPTPRASRPPRHERSPRARRSAPRGAAAPAAPRRPLARARAAAGWMVSAMLVVLLVVMSPSLGPRPGGAPGDAVTSPPRDATAATPNAAAGAGAVPASLTAADALDLYLDRGRAEGVVLEERPDLVMLDSRPTPDGSGFEVVYLRQILERTVVPELFVPSGRDRDGRPVVTRIPRPSGDAF